MMYYVAHVKRRLARHRSIWEMQGRIHGVRVAVLQATAAELGSLTCRDYRERLSLGEIEALALVRLRGLGYCTEQRVVIAVMEELRLIERLVPVTTLMGGRVASPSRHRNVRGERVRGRV